MLDGKSLVQRKLVLVVQLQPTLPGPHSESSSSSRDQGSRHLGRVQRVGGPHINPGKHRPHTDGMTGMGNSLRENTEKAVQDSGHPSRLVISLQNGEDLLLQVLHHQVVPLPQVGLACHQIGAALPHRRMCNSQGHQSVAVLLVAAAVVVVADVAQDQVVHTGGGANEDCLMDSCLNEMRVRRDRQLQKLTGGMQTGINNQFRRGKRCRIRPCKTELSEASN